MDARLRGHDAHLARTSPLLSNRGSRLCGARNIERLAGEIDHLACALADFGGRPGRLVRHARQRPVLFRLIHDDRKLQVKIGVRDLHILGVVHQREIADGVAGREALLLLGEVEQPLRLLGRPLGQHMLHRGAGQIRVTGQPGMDSSHLTRDRRVSSS